MVVGYAAGEGAALDGLPEAVLQVFLFPVGSYHAALGAEEGLVGGAGDYLGALLKGLLEVIAHQAQNVSHIVHYGGGYVLLVHELAYSRHGLLMQHHGLAEDYQLRPVLVDKLLGFLNVYLIDIVLAYREVHYGMPLGNGVDGNIVAQGAHGLSGKVAALDYMVIHHIAQALGSMLAVKAVLPVHEGGECSHIGHLPADDSRLYLRAVEVFLHLLHKKLLYAVYELSALIVEYVLIVEGLYLLVLRIPEGGVGGAQELYRTAGAVLGGYQVDALALAPFVVVGCVEYELDGLLCPVVYLDVHLGGLIAVDYRACKRRSVHPHMIRRYNCLEPLAAHVYLHLVVLQHVAGDIAHADGALGSLVGYYGCQAFALAAVVWHHCAAGDPAHKLSVTVYFHACAHYAPIQQGYGHYAPGQNVHTGEVAVHYLLKGL